jgi:hypothetical protein
VTEKQFLDLISLCQSQSDAFGQIKRRALVEILQATEIMISSAVVSSLFRSLDDNQSGTVDVRIFLSAALHHLDGKRDDKILLQFRVWDLNNVWRGGAVWSRELFCCAFSWTFVEPRYCTFVELFTSLCSVALCESLLSFLLFSCPLDTL